MYWSDTVLRPERTQAGLQTTKHPTQTEGLGIFSPSKRTEDDIVKSAIFCRQILSIYYGMVFLV
jgi:hypothetical protein